MSSHRAADAVEVLLIEDDPTIGRNLHAGLLAHGYHAHWCRTGESGLTQARQDSPDVVLPLMRSNAIRYVQLCRAGQAKATG